MLAVDKIIDRQTIKALELEPEESAKIAGLRYVRADVKLSDRRLANVIKQCQEIPGYEIFKYYDESGDRHFVNTEDVNEYLPDITGQNFTAKDFRTWAGTVLTAIELAQLGQFDSAKQAQQMHLSIVRYQILCLKQM